MFGHLRNNQISPVDSSHTKPKSKSKPKSSSESSKVNLNVLRITLFLSLLLTAVLGGYFAYYILHHQEGIIEETSFKSTTTQIQEVSTNSITAKIKSLNAFRVFIKSNCPSLESWPNCTIDIKDYNTFAKGFIVAADIATCNHEALVTSSEIDSFVTHAADFYASSGYNDIADVVRGGIFAVNDTTFEVYNVDKPDPRGENDFILPILQIVHPNLNFGALMFNIYSGTDRIPLIDAIYSCVRSIAPQQPANFTIDDIGERCMVVTKVIKVVEDIEFRPAVVMMYPIMLQVDHISDVDSDLLGDKTIIEVNGQSYVHVGSMSAIFYWDQLLTKSVSERTDGLEILLNDGSSDFFYTFKDGIATYQPEKTLTKSTHLRMSFPITTTLPNSDFIYTLTIQSDDTFSSKYYTNGPIYASILYMGAIFFCIIIYYMYDIQTAKKWAQNDQAKRNFVRYISHEIRTPLTTVSLGIKLVMRELRQSLRLTPLLSSKDLPHPHEGPKKLPQINGSDIAKDIIDDNKDHQLQAKAESTIMATNTISPSQAKTNVGTETVVMDSLGVLESVEGSVEVAVLILTDLLNYDKIHAGTLDISCEYLNACKLVNVVGESFQVAAQAALITLSVENNVAVLMEDDNSRSWRRDSKEFIDNSFRKVFNFSGGVAANTSGSNFLSVANDVENLHPMVKASAQLARPPPPPQLVLFGDGVKLHQVLRNLISNAIKFTPEGGSVTITCSWEKKSKNLITLPTDGKGKGKKVTSPGCSDEYAPGGSFIVVVRDSGVGLSDENLKEVFSDGWQFKANMLQGGQGSGLGLWITKNIVELHHGILTCHSEGINKGCTMRLELPVLLKIDDDGTAVTDVLNANHQLQSFAMVHEFSKTADTSDNVVEEHCGLGKRILVVDDSSMCRKMVCRLLRSMSYECVEANNGEDCIKKLSSSLSKSSTEFYNPDEDPKFAFVLLDFEMPIMDGPTACKYLREQGCTLPVIGLTGNVLKADVDYFMACGASTVIAKPFSLDDFIKAVKNY